MTKIPEFLIEMSKEMHTQPGRCTSDPIWQVRNYKYLITKEGYDDHHWELCNDEGVVYRSDKNGDVEEFLLSEYPEWCAEWCEHNGDCKDFIEEFDIEYEALPDGLEKVSVQEIEEVLTTHLTESDARWFLQRKKHDYPNAYTYVASAYWSPQLKELRNWILSLTDKPTAASDE